MASPASGSSVSTLPAQSRWPPRARGFICLISARECRSKPRGDELHYQSHRTHRSAPPADLRASYEPTDRIFQAQPGTLEYFLTERYCLYAAAGEKIYRGEIHHLPWPLQPARAEIALNTMAASHGLELPPAPPLLHFARFQDVWIWPPARA